MGLTLHLILLGVLLIATVSVAIYRKWLEDHCDHYIHLHSDTHDASIINAQQDACRRLEMVGKLRTMMIAATIAYAVVIAAYFTYNAWKAPLS